MKAKIKINNEIFEVDKESFLKFEKKALKEALEDHMENYFKK